MRYFLTFAVLFFGLRCFADSFDWALRLSEQINQREAKEGVLPQHQTKVFHFNQKTERSVLLMHGLSESPNYMKGWAQFFNQRGYNVVSILLPGHQRPNPKSMTDVRAEDWIISARQGLALAKGMGDKVTVLGYSTGGTLATYLALECPSCLNQLILIAPALKVSFQVRSTTTALGHTSINSETLCNGNAVEKIGCKIVFKIDDQFKDMQEEGIISSPAMGQQVNRLITLTKPLLKSVELETPLLLINSQADTVVNPKFNHNYFNSLSAGQKTILEYPKNLGVKHIYINKFPVDGFKKPEFGYNIYYSEMNDVVSAFVDSK